MESIVATQMELAGLMGNMTRNIKKDSADRKSVDYFKRRQEMLEAYWADFQYNHDRLTTEVSPSHPYFTDKQYDRVQNTYSQTKMYINDKIKAYLELKQGQQGTSAVTAREETATGTGATEHSQPPQPLESRSTGSSSKLDEMRRKQASNFRAFLRTMDNMDIESFTQKWELEDALKTLKSRWSTIDTLHLEIDSELEGSDDYYQNAFSRHERAFNEMKRQLNAKLWSVVHKDSWTPKMEIPVFNGDYKNWVSFKDLFTEVIHNNLSISNAQKMQFLKGKLRGEAERLIQHLNISSDNYSVSWEILNNRYNNIRLIFTSHVNTLLNLPTSQQPAITHIKRIHDTTQECMNAIKNLGVDTSSWDPLIVHILLQKMDTESHNHYLELLPKPRELPKLHDFLRFLENRFTMLESAKKKLDNSKPTNNSSSNTIHKYKPFTSNNNAKQSFPAYKEGQSTSYVKNFTRNNTICVLCKEPHGINFCNKFINMTPQQKLNTIKKFNICENCLHVHKDKTCTSAKTCNECNAAHNTLLHESFNNPSCNITLEEEDFNKNSLLQHGNRETLLATAMVRVQASNGTYHQMRALIDQGSQVSLISEKAAQILALTRRHCKGVVSGIGAKESSCKGLAKLSCSSLYSDFSLTTEVFIMKQLVKNLPSCSFSKPFWSHLEGVQLSDPDFNVSRPVDILFGADVYSHIIMDGISRSDQAVPIAQQTRLGWILCGNVQTLHCNVVLNHVEDIQKFWEVEDISEPSTLSEEDSQCVQHYKLTTTRRSDGSYEVGIPLKQNFQEHLGASKNSAIAQFRQLEQKFKRNINLEQQYKLFINEYKSLGHMKQSIGNQIPEVYLPHHGVIRNESITTALRVVFNASRKTTSGFSLNDLMLKGPNLQQDLQSLLLKWRQFRYAFTADIEKMFRFIWVREQDQALQKIVWRDEDAVLREYFLCTITYGTKSAPFLAMMTLKQLAIDERSKYPSAASVLEDSFYMDDVLHGADTTEATLKLQHDLIELLKLGGFNLRKWKSNCPALLLNKTETAQNFDFKQHESTKTLGIRWNPTLDLFQFQSQVEPIIKKHTKRALLSDISKLYDPLGWLAPISTKMKLLFQKVWSLNIKWDECLSEEIIKEWKNIRDDMAIIDQFQVPRWFGTSKQNNKIELHGFCDSSTKAYACVIYCKIKNCNETKITLVAAKSKLVPVSKNISLPRLELCGALLLVKLMAKVQGCLSSYNIQSYGWTDSMVTLAWIQGDPGRWKPFVANRVRTVCQVMPSNTWRYVKSSENPADCASRGISVAQLKNHNLWWNGPLWLPNYESEPLKSFTTNEEIKSIQVNHVIKDETIFSNLIPKYSSFQKLARVSAWILRYISCIKRESFHHGKHLTLQEINNGKRLLIIHAQRNEFSEEISTLKQNKNLHSKSSLLQFNPFLDQHGVLRVGGRLKKADLNPDMMHPIILPHSHHLTDIIIDYAHKLTLHGGTRVTLANLRQKYWIIGGNRAVKKRLRNCVTCRKHNPIKMSQLMGELPAQRCNQAKPFYHTGVDFTGHVMIKANKGRGIKTTKGYIALFVCMVTKLVHLELVSDLTSSAFLAALRRMAARRGTPRHMYSDNGTNFVGASRALTNEYQYMVSNFNQEFISEITTMEIEWHFNVPLFPSAAGIWESGICCMKRHLRRVIGEQRLTFEEYSTVLTQVEAVLNSRPLCPLSEDVNDLDYLTPSSFINISQDMTTLETETDMRTRWYLTQKIVQDIWKRWRTEYLSQLTARSKWRKSQPNIQINDVVTIDDANLPPGKWAMGRVVELHPGTDGHVRVVTLKTKNGLIKRPIVKLSVLPVRQQERQPDTPAITKKPTKNRFFSAATLFLFLFLSMLSSGYCSYNETKLKDSQGFYFDKIADMRLIRDEWKIVSYYDMASYWQGTTACGKYIKYLEKLCSNIGDSHCDVLSMQLQLEYAELDYNNNLLLSQPGGAAGTRRHMRQRRGLINGVGYLASELFGVLDDRFAEQYKHDILLTRDNEDHLALLIKNQTSIIEVEYNILKRTEESLNKQHKMLNQLSLKLNNITKNLQNIVEKSQASTEFNLVAIATSNMLRRLETIQSTLVDTLMDVYQGRFNFHLISQDQLRDTLSTIAGHLTKDLTLPINTLQSNFSSIYRLLRVKARMCKDYLIFELKVPLITRDSFEIMKIFPIPRVIHNSTVATVIPVAEYIALNIIDRIYTTMTSSDISHCEYDAAENYMCHVHNPIFHLSNYESFCRRDDYTGKCAVNTSPCLNEWKELTDTNRYIYFCCGTCQFRLLCDDKITSGHIHGAGIFSMGPECLIQTQNFTIYSHNVGLSSSIYIKPKMYAPEIEPINSILNISIPISVDQNYSSHHEQLELLRKEIDLLKANENVANPISYHDIHQYTVAYIMVGFMLLAGVIWIIRRVRSRQPTQAAAKVDQATSEPIVIYERPLSKRPSSSKLRVYSISKNHDQDNVPSVSENQSSGVSERQSECGYSEVTKINTVDKSLTPMPRKTQFI